MTKEANDAIISLSKKNECFLFEVPPHPSKEKKRRKKAKVLSNKLFVKASSSRPLLSFSYLHILCILCVCVRMNERKKMMYTIL
jgi:hypothetical protein